MKRILLLLSFSLVLFTSQAQNWCHQGAQWHYSYISLGGPGYARYTYVSDTSIEGRACRKITCVNFEVAYTFPGPARFTYEQGDTAYFYYTLFGKWLPTLYFGAHTGDTIVIPNYFYHTTSDSSVTVVVDSTGSMLIDTFHLRYYSFHFLDTCMRQVYHGRAIERLGMMDNDMMPFWHCLTDDTYYHLCNYQDDSFAVYPSAVDCQSLPTGIDDIKAISLRIYPDPAHDAVTISADQDLAGGIISITDMSGRLLSETELKTGNTLQTNIYADGVYMVTIDYRGRKYAMQKLVVQH